MDTLGVVTVGNRPAAPDYQPQFMRLRANPAVSRDIDRYRAEFNRPPDLRLALTARDGLATGNLVWKDAALIPVGSTVDLLIDASNPGAWMLHCHIAEHLGSGMMAVMHVTPTEGPRVRH